MAIENLRFEIYFRFSRIKTYRIFYFLRRLFAKHQLVKNINPLKYKGGVLGGGGGWLPRSSDPLFPGERRLISLQFSGMLSISLRFHCLSPDMFCTAFSHAKPPRNIHAAHEVTLSRL